MKTSPAPSRVNQFTHRAVYFVLISGQNSQGETAMRPWVIMGSAAVIALLMTGTYMSLEVWNQTDGRVKSMQTTLERPGGVDLGSNKGWEFTCAALFSAPKAMEVNDTADVETDLITTADHAKADALIDAAQKAADAINNGSATTATDALAGLDRQAADAFRRIIDEIGSSQAAADSLPGSPIMTAHLSGQGFKITPDTPERQAVTAKTPAIWRWTIKAVDPGERNLTVSYSAEVLVADQRVPQSLRTISRTILVSVTPAGLLKDTAETTSSVKSIAENISWFWTTLIFPVGIFLRTA